MGNIIEQIAQKICKIGTGCSLDCVLIPEYREQFRQCATEIYQLCEAGFLKKAEGGLPENPHTYCSHPEDFAETESNYRCLGWDEALASCAPIIAALKSKWIACSELADEENNKRLDAEAAIQAQAKRIEESLGKPEGIRLTDVDKDGDCPFKERCEDEGTHQLEVALKKQAEEIFRELAKCYSQNRKTGVVSGYWCLISKPELSIIQAKYLKKE